MREIGLANEDITGGYMHGRCAQLNEYIKRYINTTSISIVDYDDLESEETVLDLLVHTASVLPNGKIIDGANIYDSPTEFQEYVDRHYDAVSEFIMVTGEVSDQINKKQTAQGNKLEDVLSINKGASKSELAEYAYAKTLVRYIQVLLKTNSVHDTLLSMNNQYMAAHKDRYFKIISKFDYELLHYFKNSEYAIKDDKLLGLKIPLQNNNKFSQLYILPHAAYLVEHSQEIRTMYNLNVDTIQDAKTKMIKVLRNLHLGADLLEITKAMRLTYSIQKPD